MVSRNNVTRILRNISWEQVLNEGLYHFILQYFINTHLILRTFRPTNVAQKVLSKEVYFSDYIFKRFDTIDHIFYTRNVKIYSNSSKCTHCIAQKGVKQGSFGPVAVFMDR